MTAPATTRPGPRDTFRQLGNLNAYREALARGMSLSAHLETEDPSENYKDGLDAFGRLMKAGGIRSRSDVARGFYASTWEEFNRDENSRALIPEWASRVWKRASGYGDPDTRVLLTSSDPSLGSVLRPYVDSAIARYKQLAPAVPIDQVVAITTPIDGDAYRAFYLTDVTAQERWVRTAQGAELPRAKLVGGDHTIRLYKYGRMLEFTYELLRRQRIDLVALQIARTAIQAQIDKLATIIDIIVNGDGNASTSATNYNLTTLDSGAVAGTLTLKGWLAFKLKFLNPYQLTVALAQDVIALPMQLLNTGSANIPLVNIQASSGFGSFRPINPELSDNVGLGITADAPANKIVGIDSRFGIERVVEIGADITEVERFVSRQTQGLALSEVEGYDCMDSNALKILTVNA